MRSVVRTRTDRKRARTPAGEFTSIGRARGDAVHTVVLFVRGNASELARLPAYLVDVSEPTSSKFGQHWAFDDMRRFANATAFDDVVRVLTQRGVQVCVSIDRSTAETRVHSHHHRPPR
jgi:hypothetical protein